MPTGEDEMAQDGIRSETSRPTSKLALFVATLLAILTGPMVLNASEFTTYVSGSVGATGGGCAYTTNPPTCFPVSPLPATFVNGINPISGNNGPSSTSGFATYSDSFGNDYESSATANLASGELSLVGTVTNGSGDDPIQACCGDTENYASFADTLTIDDPNYQPGAVAILTATVTGALSASGDNFSCSSFGGAFDCEWAPFDDDFEGSISIGSPTGSPYGPSITCSYGESAATCTEITAIYLSGTVTSDVSVGGYLDSDFYTDSAGESLIFDVNDPLTLTLPPGSSYTSASGVFLSEAVAATPEPSSLMLLGTGSAFLLLIGNFKRRVLKARRH